MQYENWMSKKIVIGSDWPLSLGYKVSFFSLNKHFVEKPFLVSKRKLQKAFEDDDVDDFEGMASTWGKQRLRAICIMYTGDCTVRFIELVAHEASHMVDYILADTLIVSIDTELRAYMLDWIVGKILAQTNINKK